MKYTLIALLISGCANLPPGVEMTEDERAACAAQGCSVWTFDELQRLVNMVMQRGYAAGRKSL